MTDYADMQPAEIDTLVAERVMGWYRDVYGFWRVKDDQATCVAHVDWSPSTSIADAWEVVERMRSYINTDVGIWNRFINFLSDWALRVDFTPHMSDLDRMLRHIEPAAICIAALRALGDD